MTDSINREDVIRMAKESGFKACVGTTDKEGNYHPFVNALGKDIPIEWLERFAALAALRAQPAAQFKKLSDDEVLWIAQSHGIDVYASNPLAFYADLISTTPAQPDHSELVKDAARYAHVLECDYLATKTYLPDTTREERYAKLREKHDAGRKAIGETME